MNRVEAEGLLADALRRIRHPQKNANGGAYQAGGAYWRLAKVLREYLEPALPSIEGQAHADHIFKHHGRIQLPAPENTVQQDILRLLSEKGPLSQHSISGYFKNGRTPAAKAALGMLLRQRKVTIVWHPSAPRHVFVRSDVLPELIRKGWVEA